MHPSLVVTWSPLIFFLSLPFFSARRNRGKHKQNMPTYLLHFRLSMQLPGTLTPPSIVNRIYRSLVLIELTNALAIT